MNDDEINEKENTSNLNEIVTKYKEKDSSKGFVK